jgi:hypothetical protein
MEADMLGQGLASKFRICRPVIIPGRVNRIMNAVIPAAVARRFMGRTLAKTVAPAATAPRPYS